MEQNHKAALPVTPSPLTPLLEPIQRFLNTEAAGGVLLMAATVIALVWANLPGDLGDSYAKLWHSKLSLAFGDAKFALSLEHWVNDGLMVIFFLLVGLEIKRELLMGELASVRKAALPVAAAIGGMLVPAGIYLAFNPSGPGARGWGIPMATDIAFAVGVVALAGRSVPLALRVFLLAIAIVDDLGAVMVIAVFYTSSVSLVALAVAGVFLALLIALNVLRVHQPLPYLLLGVGLWLATLASGVHATIAGVLLALVIPASRQLEESPYVEHVRDQLKVFERDALTVPDKITADQSHALASMMHAAAAVQAPLARVEHALLRPVNFLIVPLFALANAGVDLRGGIAPALASPVAWGVLAGLFVGKPVGVLLASFIAVKTGIASFPAGTTMRHLVGLSVLCGIGFTMSLFVANLAFPGDPTLLAATKVGILGASALAGVLGAALLAWPTRNGSPPASSPNHP